jgi:dihydroneopterin aldolase
VLISLVGMRFHVLVGILPHERAHPQPLEVDLTVTRAEDEPDVLDYRGLYAMTAGVIHAGPVAYLEQLAATLADGAMALPGVSGARVAVRKPHVMLDGPLAYAEIVVERARG